MDTISPDRCRNIGPIVDNAKCPASTGSLDERSSPGYQITVFQVLITKLDHPNARVNQLANEPIELDS